LNRAIPGIRISVADNGSGIPAELLQRIFEPFVTTKGETGTGLGLWVTAELVHKLAGRIRVKSRTATRPNDSRTIRTVFSIFFPAYMEALPLTQNSEVMAVETVSHPH
jgi:signal transduction histidine kinase